MGTNKITLLLVSILLVLSWCASNQEETTWTTEWWNNSNQNDDNNQEISKEDNEQINNADAVGASIENKDSSSEWVEIIEINRAYDLPNWQQNILKGELSIKDWIIKEIEIEKNWPKQTILSDKIWELVIWKSLSDAEIDTVSWATLTSYAFNEFIQELNN